jgi:hypothetical protein
LITDELQGVFYSLHHVNQTKLFLGKKGGDNTDYGDANVYLLEYLEKEYNKNGKVTPFSIDSYVQNYWLKQYQGGASLPFLSFGSSCSLS